MGWVRVLYHFHFFVTTLLPVGGLLGRESWAFGQAGRGFLGMGTVALLLLYDFKKKRPEKTAGVSEQLLSRFMFGL